MSFQLIETFYLKNKDNLQKNSRRHASVLVKKQKKVTELKKLVVSMREIMKSEKEEAKFQVIEMNLNSKEKAKTLKSKNDYICALKKEVLWREAKNTRVETQPQPVER